MTLDEAIKHCKEKSCSNTECAKEHKQLGEWLIELKQRREQEEHVSEDLEEAAMQYAKLKHKDFALQEIVSWDFKAGVKWQKEQLKANTVDATIGLPYENKDGGYTQLIDVSRPLPVGKNKIAIIFKEVQ